MKIAVYDDSLDFGGHQIMACRGIEALAADPALEVVMLCPADNRRLNERLAGISRLQVVDVPGAPRRLPGLRNRLDRHSIRKLALQFRQIKPDRIVCIQGDIEQSSRAVLAARGAGIECVSYLAVAHRKTDMHAKLGRLRDRSDQCLLNRPDRYMAISEGMRQMLSARGVKKPITVIPNGIPMPHAPCPMRQERQSVLGMIGRIEFNQKRQDFMVDTFCSHADAFKNCRLLIAGSGPDERRLKKLVKGCSRRDEIALKPWQDDMETLLDQIHFLMLPSRYEGVPLVMLEALARGIPVIGSACDGMAELLPEAWLFERGNAGELATTFAGVRHIWQHEIGPLQDKVRSEMTLEAFQSAFRQAIIG